MWNTTDPSLDSSERANPVRNASGEERSIGENGPGRHDRSDAQYPTETDDLALDRIFGVLKNQRRRQVLEYLGTTDGQASLSDLSEQIAAWENDKAPRMISSSERKRVYVGLYQSHLPKMDDAGAISYNKQRGLVEEGPAFAEFEAYLPSETAPRKTLPRRLYRGLLVRTVAMLENVS
jgi:hypothetical protein